MVAMSFDRCVTLLCSTDITQSERESGTHHRAYAKSVQPNSVGTKVTEEFLLLAIWD